MTMRFTRQTRTRTADWLTAELNQNGKVTTRFVTRTDAEGAFVMRHYAYTSGGLSGVFEVPVTVRIEGVLTKL
ncbi:hypothetical protein [Polyangium fumosum]|uniref:hypothetical protein n=1 Tax=Polyangium fumosum TaxID=889272 RepID=UPI0010ADCAC0|nr:hypothetical protein [Polyangium fumosum]